MEISVDIFAVGQPAALGMPRPAPSMPPACPEPPPSHTYNRYLKLQYYFLLFLKIGMDPARGGFIIATGFPT